MVLFAITNQQDGQQESFQREEIEALHQNYKERQQGDGTKRSAPDGGETNQQPSKKRNRSTGKDTEKGDSSPTRVMQSKLFVRLTFSALGL